MLKHFKPFLIALALFVVTDSLILYTPISQYLDKQVRNYLQLKLEEVQHDTPKHLDILFLGTSRTNDGFATNICEANAPLKVNAYNMGIYSGDFYLFNLVLKNHLHQYGKPKLILLEVADFLFNDTIFSDNNVLYFRKLIEKDPSLAQDIFNSPLLTWDNKKEIILANLSGLYRYRSILDIRVLPKMLLEKAPEPLSFQQGWEAKPVSAVMQNQQSIKTAVLGQRKVHYQGFTKINTARLRYFLDLTRQEGIPVVMVQWPSHPIYETMFKESTLSKPFYDEIQKISQEYHAPFIDLTAYQLKNSEGFFADPIHLSRPGAEFYTRYLTRQLFSDPQVQALFHISPITSRPKMLVQEISGRPGER